MNRRQNSFRKFLNQPKLIMFAGFCTAASLIGVLGLLVMIGWLTNIPILTQLHHSLPPIPFSVGFCFFCISMSLLTSLRKAFHFSRAIAIFLSLFSALLLFEYLIQLNLSTNLTIFKSSPPIVISVKSIIAFILMSFSIIFFTSKEKSFISLWLIAILNSIVFAMSLCAIFQQLNRIDLDYEWVMFNRIDLHIAFGLFISSSVILYLTNLKFRSTYPIFCMRWLSLLAFISLLWSTISFYVALKNQETLYRIESLEHEASQMLKFVIYQSDVDKKSFKRIQGRWNNMDNLQQVSLWEMDSQEFINDIMPLRGLIALKPDKSVRGEIGKKDFPIKSFMNASLDLLNLEEETWHPVEGKDGRNVLFIYYLLNFPDGEKGYLIAFYDLESMINASHKFILKSEMCLNIFYQNKSLYNSNVKAMVQQQSQNQFIFSEQIIGDWKLLICAPRQDPKSLMYFPNIFFVLGVLMSFLIGYIFHLYQKFKRQSFLLYKANAAQSHFLANVSHEIRTPLHAIIGTVSLLDYTELNSRQEHLLHILKTASNHLLDLINNLLDITKIETENIVLKYIPTDIRGLSLDVISLFSQKAEEKGLNLRFDFNFPEDQKILIPPREVKQIMTNLIGNALKFTNMGIITVEVNILKNEFNKGKLNINISDTGIGIPEEKKQCIFEKFSQIIKDESIKHPGTGLGLYISKLLVNEMKGQIRFESIDGQGTTFFVSIPIIFVQPNETTKHEKI
ncbi:MAG: hypothetical protein H0X29_07495 [Parachlamydiaceae bacterium]|nr:hypothetical protein [Parachlamydiaceae bacterium]